MSSAADLSTETWSRIQYIPSDKINVENSAIQSLTSRLFSDQTSVICSYRKTIDGNRDTWALKLASLSTTWQTQGLSIYHPVEHYLEKNRFYPTYQLTHRCTLTRTYTLHESRRICHWRWCSELVFSADNTWLNQVLFAKRTLIWRS